MRRSIHALLAAAVLLAGGTTSAATAAGLPIVALASELRATRTVAFPDAANAKLICSSDTGSIVVNGTHYDAAALARGIAGVTSCRWFVLSGADWVEAPAHLADVGAHVTANFMAPTAGAEPRLYELVGVGATGDFDAAVASITASYGPPQGSDMLGGGGKQEIWELPGIKVVVTQKDPQYGNLVIDYLQPDLEDMVAHP